MQEHVTEIGQRSATEQVAVGGPLQAVCAFILGAVVIYSAGFLDTPAVHNAAHDTRHSQGFPCH